ncbi:MAG TPA: 30S ribosome-binding factor RbfA [Firmicutes bacterium]|nr:30S ribosome-binding factor RbfA [Bacillota bacterium]
MPDDIRVKRIASFLQRELSRIVSRELKDPIFDGKLISFNEIRVSRDLSIAHVYVSIFGDNTDLSKVVVTLTQVEPYIRSLIVKVSELRKIPTFIFHEDRTMEVAAKIDRILDSLDIPPEEPENEVIE